MLTTQIIMLVFVVCVMIFATARELGDIGTETAAKSESQVSGSVIAIPPGNTILEQLESKGMSKEEFSHEMGLTVHETNDLLNGTMEIGQSIAFRLERVLGMSVTFWKNLDMLYRDKLKQIAESGEKA